MMTSRPKDGKSDTARNGVKAIATGGLWLGRRCKKGKALWIGLEEPVAHLMDRLEVMSMTTLDNIVYVVEQPQGDESKWLRAVVKQHRPDIVFIDTIGRFCRIEEINSYSQVTRATQPLLDLRTQYGTTFVFLHHQGNNGKTLGSTMWEGVVDTIMSITRSRENKRFVQTKQRSGSDMEPTVLSYNPENGEITCAESAFMADKRIAEQNILAYIETVSDASREELANKCGRLASIGRAAVDSLASQGLIVATGDGKRSSPRRYSKIRRQSVTISSVEKPLYMLAEDSGHSDPNSASDSEETPGLSEANRGNPKIPVIPVIPEDSGAACDAMVTHPTDPKRPCRNCGQGWLAHQKRGAA